MGTACVGRLLCATLDGMKPSPLPAGLASEFSVAAARSLGVSNRRLRASDLDRPFRGARVVSNARAQSDNHYERTRDREFVLIRALGATLCAGQFLSHRSAALLWGAPVPYLSAPELHVGVVEPQRTPRIDGVLGHNFAPSRAAIVERDGLALTSPALTFATSGQLPLPELVALGDYFVRVYRPGHGRRDVGRPPLATIARLGETVGLGRWRGAARLRQALGLVREDSWSPRESMTRVVLRLAGVPEPELNVDVFDDQGRFLACLDMVYPRFKVGVEYHGVQHSERYAEDVERIEALRECGWVIVQVTKVLADRPHVMAGRVAKTLRDRGWDGQPDGQ